MSPEESPQLRRFCEGDHVIVNRQMFCLLPLQPLLAFMLLAVGTAAMDAGMGNSALMLAAIALQNHHAAVLISATPHGLQSSIMARKQLMLVVFFQIAAVAIDQFSSYLYRGVLPEKNIIADRDGKVRFCYQDNKGKRQVRTLPGGETFSGCCSGTCCPGASGG